jgi:hypothetical protein
MPVSVSSCSRFLVAGFHPRGRSVFAVSHDLDDLTFLVPSSVFQPVTHMGFGYPLEYPRDSRRFRQPKPPSQASLPGESISTRSGNRRSCSTSRSSRQAGACRPRRR